MTMDYIQIFMNISITDVIDIAIVAFIIYKALMLLEGTRALQLFKGIAVILALVPLSSLARLYMLNWLLERAMTVFFVFIIVVFQPELRRALEYIGRNNLFSKKLFTVDRGGMQSLDSLVTAIAEATVSLSRQRIGGLIVIKGRTGLNEVIDTGTKLDSLVTSELLINIFIPNTPLHDGAVVIEEGRITAAACILPLSSNTAISKELGTRHRSALGISENSDAMTIVISEETGAISMTKEGRMTRYLDLDQLKSRVTAFLKEEGVYGSGESVDFFSKVNQWRKQHERRNE
jgi:diadenylate cyclase